MRICHVVEASSGGVGQVVVDLARGGQAAGLSVTVIYAPLRSNRYFVESLASIPGVSVISLQMRREVGVHDLKHAWNLFRALRAAGPFDVIHGHSSKAGALARIAGLAFPNAVKIYTPHAFATMTPGASSAYGKIEWVLSAIADAVICASRFEHRHAREQLGIGSEKLVTIPNGVDLAHPGDRETARAQTGFDSGERLVGFVGRLMEPKNPQRLARAFAIVAATRPDLRLAIVGDGPLRNETEQVLTNNGILDKVIFLGERSGRDIIPAFDCLVCSSDSENFGLVVLEAMAAGVPVVSTPVGITEQAILDGTTGFIARDFSPHTLANALDRLFALPPDAYTRMCEAARARAATFGVDAMIERTHELYRALIAARLDQPPAGD